MQGLPFNASLTPTTVGTTKGNLLVAIRQVLMMHQSSSTRLIIEGYKQLDGPDPLLYQVYCWARILACRTLVEGWMDMDLVYKAQWFMTMNDNDVAGALYLVADQVFVGGVKGAVNTILTTFTAFNVSSFLINPATLHMFLSLNQFYDVCRRIWPYLSSRLLY
jgi:hypothetical protein